LHPINLGKPTHQTSEIYNKERLSAGRGSEMPKKIHSCPNINKSTERHNLLQPAALFDHCEIYALLLEPASSAEDA